MSHITVTEEIAAPVEAVFGYVDDHLNTTRYMKDLTRWAPAGAKTHGKGAKFEVAMKAGPMTLSSVVDITTWVANQSIGWKSIEGFKQTGMWTFEGRGGSTEATFDMEFELPGGIAGRVLSRAAEPVVRSNIQQSVRDLRSQVEALVKKPVKSSGSKQVSRPTAKGAAKKPAKPPARKR